MVAQRLIGERYEIREPLGEGGMGIVYRAFDTKTKSFVALKTMRDATDPAAVELFSKEWTVLAGISHPNIVDIRDVGEIEEHGQKRPFFVMPLLPGVTLAQLIESSSPRLTVDRVVGIITQVCRGLQAAHERGLVHRDIKPSNIFVMEDDSAKIIDFGVVHLAGGHSDAGLKGTWQYMAPEQIETRTSSPISDLFSLGVVCYQTLTSRKPFARKTAAQTAEAVRTHIPPPISEINPSVPHLISMTVHKAMAKQPMHRFSSVRDFSETLQKAALNQPIDRFDRARIQPRIERAKKTLSEGDPDFAAEILSELEAEGHIDAEIAMLRGQIDHVSRQKTVRQYLESARTRIEQDEIPLALEKLQALLEIDPENVDALAMRSSIEERRNERQIENWMSLARRHLDRHAFADARQALKEVLKIQSNTAALALLAETDRREQDSVRIRAEKEKLYGSAMNAFQGGEISTALSKLERILDLGRQTPDAIVPERDAVYQSFYNQVRTARDTIHNAYDEARRHLAEKNSARAIEICDELLKQYPADAMCQALKLESVEQQRQEQSSYIAEVGRRVDAEQDLDRKVNIFKEACERFPAEQQFQQSLKLARERRDLLLSIVARARQYEEKNQFADAIGQWDIVRKIYARYPGIDFELAQLAKRRDQQGKEESKARLVEQIDRALESGEFNRARELAVDALAEYPADPELAGLERLARQGLERSGEAKELCTQAQALGSERKFEEAVEILRRASELDPKNPAIRAALVSGLIEQARSVIDVDWRKAEPLVHQVGELDAANAGARNLRTLISDSKRKEFVSKCLTEARELQAAGKVDEALATLAAGLAQYPKEVRLTQLQVTLENTVRDVRSRRARAEDVEVLSQLREDVERKPVEDLRPVIDQTAAIVSRHPDDPEVTSVAAEIRQRAGASVLGAGGELTALFSTTEFAPNVQNPAGEPSPKSGEPAGKSKPVAPEAKRAPRKPFPWPSPKILAIYSGTAALLLIVAAIVVYYVRKPPKRDLSRVAARMTVALQPVPSDATVTINDKVESGSVTLDSDGSYNVTVSKLGYKPFNDPHLKPQATWTFKLEAVPVHLRIATPTEKIAEVFVDDQTQGNLDKGTFEKDFPADGGHHKLSVRAKAGEVLAFSFVAAPGSSPKIDPLTTKDLLIVTGLGPEATVYSGSPGLSAGLKGQEARKIPPEGLSISGVSSSNNELTFNGKDARTIPVESGNAPSLYANLNSTETVLRVVMKQNGAQLFVDSREITTKIPGVWYPRLTPGKHKVKLSVPGFEDSTDELDLKQGTNTQWNLPPLRAKQVLALLVIVGGTPGADVLLDGKYFDTLDSSGGLSHYFPPGSVKFLIRKNGFEDSNEFRRTVEAGRTIGLGPAEATLKPRGSFKFSVQPYSATISYQKVNQSSQPARNGEVTGVAGGRYTISAEADGFESRKEDVTVSAGVQILIDWKLVPVEIVKKPDPKSDRRPVDESLFEGTPPELEGAWWHNARSPAIVRKGIQRFQLTFLNQKRGFMRRAKGEWTFTAGGTTISYELDGNNFTRKEHGKKDVTIKYTGFFANIAIEASRIVISLPGAANDDVFEVPESQDSTLGRVVITKGQYFTLSR